MINPELKKLLENLSDTVSETGLRVTDECIFIQACTFMRTPNNTLPPTSTPEKASDKQKDFLYKLNADFDANTITKKDAKTLIDRLVKERGKKK